MSIASNSNSFQIFDRNFIKEKFFPILIDDFSSFLDHEKIKNNVNKLILPVKNNCDKKLLDKQITLSTKKLKKLFEENYDELFKIVKNKFSKHTGIKESRIVPSLWVPVRPRLTVPYSGNRLLNWHQDSGTWLNIDLYSPETKHKKNDWKKLVYPIWVSFCDCNDANGLEVILESDKFGLQNTKEIIFGWKGDMGFVKSIINNKIDNLKHYFFCPPAGFGNFFNSLVFHRSMKNTSNEIRFSCDFRIELKNDIDILNYGISKKILIKRYLHKNFKFFINSLYFISYVFRRIKLKIKS